MKIMITGVAGFIGSHLLSCCLGAGHTVIGIDNFLTGKMSNIEDVLSEGADYAQRFELLREDIRHLDVMLHAAEGVDLIFHEAAIGSVPWSIRDPLLAHETNLTGFLNILEAAKANHIRRVVYASSSAVFGDSERIPALEGAEGACLSVYASSKRAQEIYAEAYARCYGLEIIGLRYFNVFGRRQDPNGAYAAVIPRWAKAMASGVPCTIFGDGSATRDYCHVSNIVRANMLAASVELSGNGDALAMNIGCGEETSLLELHDMMAEKFAEKYKISIKPAQHEPVRMGDIERSVADISLARKILGFSPEMSVRDGVRELIDAEQFDIMGQ
ncbi:MAG: NAD-dependent epimerase/dehydratase family protein [Proteobacteria bacterium]|nr:NAD-dependent epimerase/dehydratase family protein [Pseudomonadota bacterium]MBQ4359343.1 NAD-dependent epimerase/dehydratase family protein [Pseudomonadota bacterium]